jgi:hypothetical protein
MPHAKSFADRLPRLVPEDEPDISHLSDELADILYPGRRQRPFRIGLVFEEFEGPGYDRAVELARRSPEFRELRDGGRLRHHAAFETSGAATLHELFLLVGERPGTEVLVDGKDVPYARELWLPLFWVFIEEREGPC